jgi:energy-converting hydrogenase Eha subunit G
MIALSSIPSVNDDARVVVGLASGIFPLCAVAAAVMLDRRRDHVAGLLLVLSAATPTYFAYALNLPALIVGLALLASPAFVLGAQLPGE